MFSYVYFFIFRAIGGWQGVKRHAKKATFLQIMLQNWNPLKQNRKYTTNKKQSIYDAENISIISH